MERRVFLKKGSFTACGMMAMSGMFTKGVFANQGISNDLFQIPRPLDTQINIKPLYGARIPAELHEGPCRPNDPATWDKNEAIKKAKQSYESWRQHVNKELQNNVKILDPVYVQYSGDHRIDQKTWNKITANDYDTDLYVLSHYRIPGLGEHTDKPIAVVGNACATLDVTAKLNSEGETAYGALNYDRLEDIIAALKVKKALQKTKLLLVTDGQWDYEFNAVRSNIDTGRLKDQFGVGSHYITIEKMIDEFLHVKKEKKYRDEAEKITKNLMNNALENTMKYEDIEPSIFYYLTAKKLMQKYGCNGFTATCQEFCVSKLPMRYKVTPCITHTLLKDEGYVSVCEADVNVFFSMALQMYLANKAPYMGNTLIYKLDKNLVSMHHDVPARKMMGYDSPDLPYSLVSFTERNWGPTMRYDFARDRGKDVTFCRMTPNADKLLVVKGQIQDVLGVDEWGCQLKAIIKVSDASRYFELAQQTGHHFSLVYGDYIDEIKKLAVILDVETDILI
jgi:L-fucose isomerase-like protein